MKSESSRYNGIDDLRFVATIGVILLHTSAGLLPLYDKVPYYQWLTGLFYNAITRFSVPTFIMISGALLLSKEYKTTDFFKKRFVRVLIPFLFYATIYLTYHLTIRLIYGHQNSADEIIHWLIRKVEGGVSYHFWFVYMILGLYLIVPLISRPIRKSSDKQLFSILIFWFAYNCVQLFGHKIVFPFSQTLNYTGYLILGYFLAKKSFINKRRAMTIGLTLFAVGYLISMAMLAIHNPMLDRLYDNFSPLIVAMSVGIFLIFKNSTPTNSTWITLRSVVCRYSFGIYLIHILILKWLSIAHIHWNLTYPAVAIPVTTLLALALSAAFVFGVSKLPFGKYISG